MTMTRNDVDTEQIREERVLERVDKIEPESGMHITGVAIDGVIPPYLDQIQGIIP